VAAPIQIRAGEGGRLIVVRKAYRGQVERFLKWVGKVAQEVTVRDVRAYYCTWRMIERSRPRIGIRWSVRSSFSIAGW